MGSFRIQLALMGTGALCLLNACFVQDAGDRSASAVARRGASTAPGIPQDVLRVPETAQAFPGAVGGFHHAWYLPYAVIDEAQGLALVETLTALARDRKPFPELLDVGAGRGAGGSNFLYPLRAGVGRLYNSDINDPRGPAATGAAIPVIISQPESGAQDADVLFLDGHKERVTIGKFPLSPAFLEALSTLDPPEH
jgi:hypothetical protein